MEFYSAQGCSLSARERYQIFWHKVNKKYWVHAEYFRNKCNDNNIDFLLWIVHVCNCLKEFVNPPFKAKLGENIM